VLHVVKIVAAIAGKIFIAAVAPERHGYITASYLRDIVSRNSRRIGKRFVVMPYELVENLESIRADDLFVMVGVKLLGNFAREGRLVVLLLFKTDRASGDRPAHDFGHHRDDRR